MLASGTWGLGESLLEIFTSEEVKTYIGALVTKGLSLKPQAGNPPPRLCETPCGLINSIGLENPGISEFKRKYLRTLKETGIPIIVNVHGEKIEDFVKLAEELEGEVEGIEINISCPNVKKGGILFSSDPEMVEVLIKAVREKWQGFLSVKISPVGAVFEIAKICDKHEVDAIVVANTYPALSVISYSPFKVLKGGLSGPAIKPLTLRLVYEASKMVKVPVIGCGGITSGKDALEYLLCGAVAFQIGTVNLIDPRACIKILEELKELSHGLCN